MRVINAYMGYIRAQLHMWALLPGLVPRFNLLARAQPSEGQQLRDELHYIAQYIGDGHNPWTYLTGSWWKTWWKTSILGDSFWSRVWSLEFNVEFWSETTCWATCCIVSNLPGQMSQPTICHHRSRCNLETLFLDWPFSLCQGSHIGHRWRLLVGRD